LCHIVDSHYFRGRLSAYEAQSSENKLYAERIFDDILMGEKVITHYLPLRMRGGKREEKGIDVWLALEAYELSVFKKFDVLVLIASDGDYVPLVRKLNTLGTRVMLLSWDFRYQDMNGRESVTRTSQELLEEVTYPVAMHELIDNRLNKNDAVISNLFDKQDENRMKYINKPVPEGVQRSRTLNMKSGYGFIAFPPNNLFFHYEDVLDGNFNEIMDGDMVEFEIRRNERGEEVAYNVRKIEPGLQ
jgi:uncharacterized LabA/DUF88 family protein/cold shock CspA family protein